MHSDYVFAAFNLYKYNIEQQRHSKKLNIAKITQDIDDLQVIAHI